MGDFLDTHRLLRATRKLRLALLFTTCQLLPRWRQWARLVAICSNWRRATLLRPQGASSSACQGNKLQPTARTFRRRRGSFGSSFAIGAMRPENFSPTYLLLSLLKK